MLIIGNAVGILTLIFFTPFMISHVEIPFERALELVTDEGKEKINSTMELFRIVIYVIPITAVNVVIMILHFYSVKYERELKERYG